MASHTDSSCKCLVLKQLKHILSLIRSRQSLVVVMKFLLLLCYNWSIYMLPIFLFYHYFCLRVHLFVSLIILLIFMKHYSVFIGSLYKLPCRLLFDNLFLLFLRLLITLHIGTNIVSKFVIKILVHMFDLL